MTPEEMDAEEAKLPYLMMEAVRLAAETIVRVEDGFLVEVFRDGTKTVIKPVPAATPAVMGQVREFR